MKTHPIFHISLLLTAAALAQGPLTPPAGAPAPTMKTLDQVEPSKPIGDTHTPGDAANLFRITAPGSYHLIGPVTGTADKNGIFVDADDVTIDLRGFALTGGAGTLDGVHVADGRARLTVRNGTISGWENHGVNELNTSATGGTYENLRVHDNGSEGLRLGDRAVVTSCIATSNGDAGISVNGRATVSRCNAHENVGSGIRIHRGSVLESVASENESHGIEIFGQSEFSGEPALVQDCVVYQNDGSGIETDGGCRIESCISRQNGIGIEVNANATVTRCNVKNNGWGIYAGNSCHITDNMCEGNGEAILTLGGRNQIADNHIVNLFGNIGINVTAPFGSETNNLIIRNTVGKHTTSYNIAADNRYGPIIDITAAGTPAVTGDSGVDTTTTATHPIPHPWANFSY